MYCMHCSTFSNLRSQRWQRCMMGRKISEDVDDGDDICDDDGDDGDGDNNLIF